MEYIEVSPLPTVCADCQEPDCYECDFAGERWILPKKQELQLQRKMKEQAIRRLQRQIREIDEQLAMLPDEE